jgi:sugar phosphate isomerase/epimerase
MRYGIVISVSKTKFGPVVFREDLKNNMLQASKIGYDAIELAVKNPGEVNVDEVKGLLEKHNLIIPVIGTGQIYFDEGLSFSDPDEIIRNKAIERVNEIIKLAKNFNSSIIIGLIRGTISSNKDNFQEEFELAENRIAACMQKCLSFSEKMDTNFLIEPLIRYNSNIFTKIEDVKKFLKKFSGKLDLGRIGVLADTYHMNVEEKIIHESLGKNSKLIKHIHFADSNRLAPGFGHIDFQIILRELKKINYNGIISFEILPLPTPVISAKKALDYIKNIELKA